MPAFQRIVWVLGLGQPLTAAALSRMLWLSETRIRQELAWLMAFGAVVCRPGSGRAVMYGLRTDG